jgi:tRNA pseudouridine32 synthase/23S rRNA pseudouridine746 synthase
MAHIGHPILGDTLYAPPDIVAMSPRLCLHAQCLRFKHPMTKEITVISSMKCDFLPEDFKTE